MNSKKLLLLAIPFALSPKLFASSLSFQQSATPNGTYNSSGFNVCGSGVRSFRINYNYGSNPSGSWGSNPYRMTATLFKNGGQISNSTMTASNAATNHPFYGIPVSPGTYTATIKFEKRKLIGGWTTVENRSAPNSIISTTTATPDFNVNNIPIPADGSPIEVCASNITINAATTSCETTYWLGVQESDRWWNRTGEYEWGTWFSGQAPNNISLQQLATNSASYWISGPDNRKGNTLFGGQLPNGQDRHYRVSICTGEPSWQCKTASIKVNGACKAIPNTKPFAVLQPIAKPPVEN